MTLTFAVVIALLFISVMLSYLSVYILPRVKVRPVFAWYDMLVGAYWDRKARALYVFPVPMLGMCIEPVIAPSSVIPFVAACILYQPTSAVDMSAMYSAYVMYCVHRNRQPIDRFTFHQTLRSMPSFGFDRKTRRYQGVALDHRSAAA